MATKIRIWKPLDNIGGSYWLEGIALIDANFVFMYKKDRQHDTKIRVICGGGLPSFRYTNETYLGDFMHLDSKEAIQKIRPWCFYLVEDSEYLKKLSEDSGELSAYLGFKHYCIISKDEMIDIVYSVEPIVEILVHDTVVESSDLGHKSRN